MQDVAALGKSNNIPHVQSAAHVRTLRKGSNDHLAINIGSESERLINNEETDEDKGHLFKSLITTGLIPRQGRNVADRIDGIWVSGSRALMRHPRGRLGLIAYWLVLHICINLRSFFELFSDTYNVSLPTELSSDHCAPTSKIKHMDLLSTNCCLRIKSRNSHFQFLGVDREIYGYSSSPNFPTKLCCSTSVIVPSRTAVLQACTVTSGLIGAVGVLIRQLASSYGNLELHCRISYTRVVMSFLATENGQISTESSQASYQQGPYFPGTSRLPTRSIFTRNQRGKISNFVRGALLPLLALIGRSIFRGCCVIGVYSPQEVVRKYSFAIWATFVGLVYGYATTISSSIIVPMASHALKQLARRHHLAVTSSNSSKRIG
ncbi:hypothetical protein Salat_1275200 [Sesamum alatum]|uniref:Uncharacterized protein n=1 Tax=Sesamum alatum TaxID=300844 RepID=A0AAE1YGC2_9LAMI|nr:hypothetical protein Salat_1275200 [Sesamum alatum]